MRLGQDNAPRYAEISGSIVRVPSPQMGEIIELETNGVPFTGQLQALGAYLMGCGSSALLSLYGDESSRVARILGVTPSTVRRWRYHDVSMPKTPRLLALSVLGLGWDGEAFNERVRP